MVAVPPKDYVAAIGAVTQLPGDADQFQNF